ncbi:MAG: winged helix-turn-helix transcriptional regulator [Gammaproteobacteria bacterium]|nr:winged helix-turn-helix transcriptional regulator [Gammaproteobacteria bacterium]MBT3723652.1 winged helix-turn-helix transcriptional regulator [Gammaproteobacteria bacterium]MBT4077266.1 winged helix-turn-helix transcriptional regulator [Gammaproteobacteria bacterium]MBT4194113.1 winged helix-turn-helix transcriptional regulator [Gammaproteobacteria bacterium]MBT4450655.1 winged helix-turn-helix transcriptional regulator [Gammaproteobacteria bacterium]
MHFGFRAMVDKPDQRLAELSFSRIHHRIMYFIGRNQNCSVSELLKILGVTKQYLNRPLKTLISKGYIDQQADEKDRRIKRLALTGLGDKLEVELTGTQRRRFAEIFDQVGTEAELHWREVMDKLAGKIRF